MPQTAPPLFFLITFYVFRQNLNFKSIKKLSCPSLISCILNTLFTRLARLSWYVELYKITFNVISHAIAYSHLFTWLVEESLNSKITLNRNSLFKYNIFNAPLLSVVRTITLNEIGIKLLKAGIEPNPGPTLNDIVIITINCNGLSNDGRLLQAIGRIKKRLKQRNAIIFLQETHNANILLLENIWTGTVNVSMGTGGSRGVITLCTKDISVLAFESDNDGRSIFTFLNIGNNNYISTANVYSPNDHVISKQFIQNTTTRWDRFTASCSDNTNGISNCFLILAGDLNCVLSPYDAQS